MARELATNKSDRHLHNHPLAKSNIAYLTHEKNESPDKKRYREQSNEHSKCFILCIAINDII
ncbi:hypothetical protein AB4232_21940, partial [Vibrio sp. 10N.286.46.A8]|uniref:hypothetical protein n=1 Tax=Vibrio sp. 10N.286.46.A8 TaxID=3229697 RepID=UPI003550D5C7